MPHLSRHPATMSQGHPATPYLRYALPLVALAVFLRLSSLAGVHSHFSARFVLARRHDCVTPALGISYYFFNHLTFLTAHHLSLNSLHFYNNF